MEFLKINSESFKISPLLSNIDDEITIEFNIESFQMHEVKLKAKLKVRIILKNIAGNRLCL